MRTRCTMASPAILVLLAVVPPGAVAQDSGAGGPTRSPVVYDPFMQSVNWLRTPQIEKEIELVAEQKQKIDKIRTEMTAEMRDIYKQLRDVKQADRYERYYALRRELWEKVERQVQDVLLDHQRDRLRQIVLQMQLRSYGAGANVLTSDTLAKELGITAEQRARLKSAQRAALDEYRQKTQEFQRQLMKEIVEKLLAELTPGQRQKLDEMMGEPYESQPVAQRGK